MSTPFHEVGAIKAFISHIQDRHIRWHLENAFQSWEDNSYLPNRLSAWKDEKIQAAIQKFLNGEISAVALAKHKDWIRQQTEIQY